MPFVPPETFTSGQVLTAASMNDISENLAYLKALSNIKSTTVNSVQSTTSTSLADITGMSVSITPTFADSKVLVTCNFQAGESGADELPFVILRGSTQIGIGTGASTLNCSFYLRGDSESTANLAMWSVSWEFLDSPATTSATTYKAQWRVRTGGQTAYLNRPGAGATFVTASTITVREVPQ